MDNTTRLYFLLMTGIIFCYGYPADNCAAGPDYWCKSPQTVLECGAIEYCKIDVQREEKSFKKETIYIETYSSPNSWSIPSLLQCNEVI